MLDEYRGIFVNKNKRIYLTITETIILRLLIENKKINYERILKEMDGRLTDKELLRKCILALNMKLNRIARIYCYNGKGSLKLILYK